MPPSLNTTLSASATVVDVALVSPSIILSSAVVTDAPSNISNSASLISALPIIKLVPVIAPALNVPDVLKFSLPKLIAPLESVMLPFAKVRFPIVDPDAVDIVDENVLASSAVNAPTLKFS